MPGRRVLLSMVAMICLASSARAAEPSRSLLIVHAEHLTDAATEWSAYRASTGWDVQMIAVAPGPNDDAHAAALDEKISNAWGDALAAGATEFDVLLLGDADENGIPTFHFHQNDPDLITRRDANYVSDHPYQTGSATRDQPHFALGRVPAQTLDEARIVLAKVKAYEGSAQPARWQRRINCLAGEGHFGALDVLMESVFTRMVDTLIPPSFDLSMTYAKPTSIYCPPVNDLTPTILKRLTEDSFLFFYVGHGSPTGLDSLYWRNERRPMLRTSDLDNLASTDAHRPIAVLACCSTGWYDLPKGEHSLAESMLFAPDGPIAVIAGSRLTHPYASAVLLESFTRQSTAGPARTLGELDLLVTRDMLRAPSLNDPVDLIATPIAATMQWATSLRDHRRMHARLYNLIGDPCLVLPDRGSDITLKRSGRTITGTITGMKSGEVDITILSARDDPADAGSLQHITGSDDPQLPEKSAVNYVIANNRTLSAFTAPVADGSFEFTLPELMDARATTITFHALGADQLGNAVAAHSALDVKSEPVRQLKSRRPEGQ